VYALGAAGLFECYNGETGKVIWSHPLHEQMGLVSTYGGRTNFPIIFEDLVILGSVIVSWGDMAVPAHRFMAFDKKTGEFRWIGSTRLRPPDTIYSAPVLATIGGQQLLIAGASDGWMYALQPRTGKFVWEYQLSRRGLNVSPTVDGDVVYTGHSEENISGTKIGAVVAVNAAGMGNITQSGEIWKELEIADGKSSILKVNDRLYCPDDGGKLFVLNAKDGSLVGRRINLGTINFASPVYADGKIYHVEKNGRWYIMTPDQKDGVKRFERGKSTDMFPGSPQVECWASPVISHGRLYILTTSALYCFEDTSKKHGASERPALAKEAAAADDQKPAILQVSPCEILLGPGEKKQLTARIYNSRGQLLKETPAELSLDGPGSVSAKGEFTAAEGKEHTATIVTAKAGELTGKARIRVVPKLPWTFDFEGLKDAPVTWVGARYRHVMRQVDGSNSMVKITTIPLGTRSRLSMGPSDLHDYTVQTDFKAAAGVKLPDVGVIAQGYTLEVSGENTWLKLMSWIAHDKRTQKELPFKLEANVWYTLKLRAANEDGKAVLQGKIWKRADKEPADWSIQMTDPMPNMAGAPGLFGNAVPPTAEIFIDNVSVKAN
jgi:outer membrane protein assembly factor BamB